MMTCRYCEYKFCWNCRAGATYEHFNNKQLGCGIGLSEDRRRGRCYEFWKKVGFLLMGLLGCIGFLIFSTPVALCLVTYGFIFEACCKRHRTVAKIICCFTLPWIFYIGLIYINVVTIPLMLIFGLVFICKETIAYCLRRRNRNQTDFNTEAMLEAEERLVAENRK